MPLEHGSLATEITQEGTPSSKGNSTTTSEQFTNYTSLLAYGMREGEAKRTYELYGVLEQALVKVTFTHDFYNNLMSNQAKYKNFFKINEQYQGSLIRAIVSSNELVISCADCSESAVKFYDHDLKKLYQLDMPFS